MGAAPIRPEDRVTVRATGSTVSLDFGSDPAEVGPAVGALRARLALWQRPTLPEDLLDRVEIALSEAINNVIRHAYAGRRRCPIRVAAGLREGRLVVVLLDRGVAPPASLVLRGARDPVGDDAPPRGIADIAEGGYGWRLIRRTVDAVSLSRVEGWTVLTLGFDLRG